MQDKKKLHDFATKWSSRIADPDINYLELVDCAMADDCADLGFVMDCGNAFSEKYGEKASYNDRALNEIIGQVDDIPLLGSAIYSRWRYFNHWAYSGEEILLPENRNWFLIAFAHLSSLADADDSERIKRIVSIQLDYRRRIDSEEDECDDVEVSKFSESVVLDRNKGSLLHTQINYNGSKQTKEYEAPAAMEALLDELSSKPLFEHIAGDPEDAIDDPRDRRRYSIRVSYEDSTERVIRGSFDKFNLPDDYARFARAVNAYLRTFGSSQVLESVYYEKTKRRKCEYINCFVVFHSVYKSYYYISDDDSIEIGDLVVVPAGKDNHHAVVEVVDIEYFTEEDVPLPLDKTKHIIRKCMSNEDNPIIVMATEPAQDLTPDDLLHDFRVVDDSDENLAAVYAIAFNQVGWLMHEYDEEYDPEIEDRYLAWSKVEAELREEIFSVLRHENPVALEKALAERKGYYYIVKPFMERNGYLDGQGWFIKAKDISLEEET